MMELFLGFVSALGPAGFLFLVLMVGLNLGLTQVVRDVVRSYQRRRRRRVDEQRRMAGLSPLPADEVPPLLGGVAVMALSTAIGGVLGGVMLAAVAPVIGIQDGPSAGVLAGLLLGAATAGLVGYWNQQAEQRNAALRASGVAAPATLPPDLLPELFAALATARAPVVQSPSPWKADPAEPVVLADPRPLRPASERDVYETQHDGEDF